MQPWEEIEGTWLDSGGELVTTRRFASLQQALARQHPDCCLAFDRPKARFVVVRRDRRVIRLQLDADTTLAAVEPFYVVIFPCVVWEPHPLHPRLKVPVSFRPSDWVLRVMAAMDREALATDNTAAIQRALRDESRRHECNLERKADQLAKDLVAEAVSNQGPRLSRTYSKLAS